MENVAVTFKYTEQDYISAYRLHYAKHLNLKVSIPAAILFILLSLTMLVIQAGFVWLWCILIGLSSLILISAYASLNRVPQSQFKSTPMVKETYTFTFSLENIVYHTESIKSSAKWDIFNNYLEDDNSIIMYYGKREMTIIPKRIFADNEELNKAKDLMAEHFGFKKVFKQK
jgi:hypothetical protein